MFLIQTRNVKHNSPSEFSSEGLFLFKKRNDLSEQGHVAAVKQRYPIQESDFDQININTRIQQAAILFAIPKPQAPLANRQQIVSLINDAAPAIKNLSRIDAGNTGTGKNPELIVRAIAIWGKNIGDIDIPIGVQFHKNVCRARATIDIGDQQVVIATG